MRYDIVGTILLRQSANLSNPYTTMFGEFTVEQLQYETEGNVPFKSEFCVDSCVPVKRFANCL